MENKNFTYKQCLMLVGGGIVLYWFLQNIGTAVVFVTTIFGVISPLLLGFIIAFVLNVLVIRFENLFKRISSDKWSKMYRPISILLSIITIVAVVYVVMLLVIPELFDTISVLGKSIPKFFDDTQLWINANVDNPQVKELFVSIEKAWNENSKDILNAIASGASGMVGMTLSILSSLFGLILNLVIAIVFAVYILMNKEGLKKQAKLLLEAYLPQNKVNYIMHVGDISRRVFSNFIIGQFTEAVILGTLCAVSMALLKFPYATMIGSLVGITALIPVVGAFIGAAVGGFMIMMINPFQAVMFVIFIIVLQQIEGNLIYPRVVGSSVGLSPIWVLAAITVGGGLYGILGILLAVPIASIFSILLREHAYKKLNEKKEIKAVN